MLPRIDAEERLKAIESTALGGGHVEKHEARKATRELVRIASGRRGRAVKATPEMLASAGIAVIEQPATGARPDCGEPVMKQGRERVDD
jgi:hypothetical protein